MQPRLRPPRRTYAVSNGADLERGKRTVPTRHARPRRSRRKPGGAPGSEVSRSRLLQDKLLQGQVRDRPAEALVLSLQRLQPLDLIALQAALLGAPTIIRDLRHFDGPDGFSDLPSLRDQDIDLAQLGDDLFSRMLLPSHENILHMARGHTSGRTTFQGAGHAAFFKLPGVPASDMIGVPGAITEQSGRQLSLRHVSFAVASAVSHYSHEISKRSSVI